ncbi:MAG: chromosome segregation protein SMC [Syntrophales bacterium]
MKLKKLEIIGFKSFKDPTVFNFSDGISGIVGPNGCGKSNIVDALRWVMGEQNARLLRGKKMEDVIFGGSEDAPAVNMAEVSIVLANDGTNFPQQYAGFSEVMITRRVFREGESEYYINKVPCRLLDIREFFMDTGIGARTYSLIEQNSISNLVEAKPEERRHFLEEAAGIAKYRSRKESAFRKMESTKQNIVRLNDIIREVKTQLNSVTRQARRAEKYKDLKKEMKELDLALALENFSVLAQEQKKLQAAWDELHADETRTKTRLEGIEAACEEMKSQLLDNEELKLQERLYHLKNEISTKEQGISYSRKKLDDLSQKRQKNSVEINVLHARRSDLEEEMSSLGALLAESEEKAGILRQSIGQRQKSAESRKNSERGLYRALEEKKSEYITLATENAKLRNMAATLEKGIEDLRRRAERDIRDLDENNEKMAFVRDTLDALYSELAAAHDLLSSLEEKEKVLLAELEHARAESAGIDARISGYKEDLGRKTSRLFSLKEFQEGYEWCNEGARSILRAGKAEELSCAEIFGVVADHIDVPREYETAVEAVLGEKLQYMVVQKAEDGIQAIDYLKKHASGRGSFVPLEVRNNSAGLASLEENLNGAVKLIDVIKVREDFKSIADYLLGDVLLISSLHTGVSMWRRNGFSGTLVTPEGDIISPHGVLTGGASSNGESGLLHNRREMAELEQQINDLSRSLQEASSARTRIEETIARCEEECQSVRAGLREMEIKINNVKKDIERFENERKWIEQRIHVLAYSKDHLAAEETEAADRIKAIREEILLNEEKAEEINNSIISLTEQWEETRAGLEVLEKELTEERVLLASFEEKRNSNRKSLDKLASDIAAILSDIDARTREITSGESETSQITAQIADAEENIRRLYSDCSALETDLARARDIRAEKESRLASLESEAREARKALDEVMKKAGDIRTEIHRTTLEIEALKKENYEKYYVDLSSLIGSFTRLDESARRELEQKLEKNRKVLEDFGEVNLLAIEEHEQLKARYDFLTAQVTDLNESLDALQRTISRINRISRKRFTETFEAVDRCFKEVFPKLFPGGKGELRLTETDDILEAGVDVIVQIPGKKTQNITLLSGGEKSLVAVALIFGIILYRPTPFLILDEADAAMDDANISLFNSLVREISSDSQIILVTHNKKTMEIADNLYGITMEKQGISTTVSVNLN